jgi:conjugal transfer ATP-binding protein TraC
MTDDKNQKPVDLRTEKPVFNKDGEAVAMTKDQKIEVEAGKLVPKKIAETPIKKEEDKGGHANKAEALTDPIQRMKEGVSKNMPKVKKTVFDNLKGLFVSNASKAKATVDKIDKSDKLSAETGEKVKISSAERQKYIDAEKLYNNGLASIKDLIAPSSVEINYDNIRIDGMYARTFYVYAYPRYLNTNWLAPIINFDVTLDISQFIYPINSGEIMKTLKKKVAQMQSSMSIMAEKGQVSDPGLETALQDAESLRREIQKGNEKFFQFALYFTIYADDIKKLDKVTKQLESLLAGKLVLTKRAQVQAEHGFNSTIPQGLDELDTVRNMNTSPLSTTFPFTSSDLTSNEGILYGINRHNDGLIIFDRFELENANSVVFAKSGAGKSYAVKLEILRMMMLGTDVMVIDPENEYEALSQTVGGTYLKLSLNSDRRINPFDLPKPLEGDEVKPGDLVRSAVINLHGLMKLMLGKMTPEEESLLDKALLDTYALKGITMEVVDPSTFEPPTMEDLHNILSSMDGADSLAKRLSKFTTGSFGGIFNKPTNVDLSGGLMVFCIRDLEDELRPIAMYIILNYIWSKVRSELKKRILVIDEAWTMMQHEDSAKFLYGLVKRARKYYLGVTTITQDVEDFVKSPHGKPIITNSSLQVLLRQAPASIDILAKMFNLTEGEKYVLLNSGVGQGLFFAGNKHVAIQIIASFLEDKIVTTNPEEILKAKANDAEFETDEKDVSDT